VKQDLYKRATEDARTLQEFAGCFLSGCDRCSLSIHQAGYNPVVYRGNPYTGIMLIGEAPGMVEQQTGRPFVGPAGELLDKMFNSIGLDTNSDMLITNVVYCRPTAPTGSGRQNYTPKDDQIARCWGFGRRAREIANPKILIPCGLPAAKLMLDDNSILMKDVEGRWLKSYDERDAFVIRHPASILHLSSKPDIQLRVKQRVRKYLQHFRDTYKEHLNGTRD
jgi:DNA polymerase